MLRTVVMRLVLAIPGVVFAAEAAAPLPDAQGGLVGWYRFANAATLGRDDSGRHHDASVVDGVTWTDRDAGRRSCAVFAGKARLSVPAVARGDFTIALWVKSAAPTQPGAWYSAPPLLDGDVPGDAKDFGAVLLDGRFALGQGQPDAATSSESRIADGAWRHVAATRDATSGEVRIYVDARLERTATGPTGERSAVTALAIGARPGAGDGFTGRLDDLRIYDRVLSAPELLRLAHGLDTVKPLLVRDTRSDTWAGTDALGRSLPEPGSVPARSGKAVGIFYFLWIGRHGPDHVYDISALLRADPTDPRYGPEHAYHWWGEPLFGHYRSNDEWVIRKHAQMLTDAGVDVVFFDVTNGPTYLDTVFSICRIYREIRAAGGRTPQISFICWSGGPRVVQTLYDELYSKGLYSELWFRWLGKPLILTPLHVDDPKAPPPHDLDAQLVDFFTIRQSWAWTKGQKWFGDGKDRWAWLDRHPQNPGWHDAPDKPEQMPVGVAGHPIDNLGRSFHDGKEPAQDKRDTAAGACFAEQWQRALAVDPQFVFVTGWNEWVAMRFVHHGDSGPDMLGRKAHDGASFFVDTYDQEFSRDIEPMRGGHGDDFYYQLAENIRRFKGGRPLAKPSSPRRMVMGDDFSAWTGVGPDFSDDVDDVRQRSHPGFADSGLLVDDSARNDLDTMKVARDADTIAFYARTRQALTASTGHHWMLLFLDTDGDHRNGWNGYDFVLNRTNHGGKTVLERCLPGWKFAAVAELPFAVHGNELQMVVPRALLGVDAQKGPLSIDFKWADGVGDSGDLTDWLGQGDVAPNGRFNYRFTE